MDGFSLEFYVQIRAFPLQHLHSSALTVLGHLKQQKKGSFHHPVLDFFFFSPGFFSIELKQPNHLPVKMHSLDLVFASVPDLGTLGIRDKAAALRSGYMKICICTSFFK